MTPTVRDVLPRVGCARVVGVEDRVCGFVDHRFGRLGGLDGDVDNDALGAVDRGVAVGLARDGFAGHGPAVGGHGAIDRGRVVSGEPMGGAGGDVGSLVRLGLVHVEHGQDRNAAQQPLGVVAGLLVGLGDLLRGETTNLDGPLALADLSALGLPLPEPGHQGRAGSLARISNTLVSE